MKSISDWKVLLKRITIKDIIIVLLVIINCHLGIFIWQNDCIIDELNTENERLQLENERMSHQLEFAVKLLQKQMKLMHSEKAVDQLRDPFRPDHPTRKELRSR